MNIKAEKIEQILQAVNRNLNLVISGNNEVLSIELLKLDKVDAVVFGHDKFAYEMVHFVKSTISDYKIKNQEKKNVADLWEQSFLQGLETLLVECAIVNDDIERDCFVSRVYCWFTEKLSERRELPKKVKLATEMNDLKASLKSMNVGEGFAMKALNNFNPENSVEASKNSNNNRLFDEKISVIDKNDHNDRDFPTIQIPDKKSKFGPRNVPIYVKHGFPSVLSTKTDYTSFLPKIPGADENYGMIYNKPETEAEKKMHELWIAKRRQEAFDFKTQQQLALVMDRLALHKSRLESDSLRRLESIALLKERHFINDDDGSVPTKFDRFGRPIKERRSRSKSPNAKSPHKTSEKDKSNLFNSNVATDSNMIISGNGVESEASVAKPSRVAVTKQNKQLNAPMKFKMELPEDYATHQKDNYMQLSDSDDDDKPERGGGAFRQSRTGTGAGKKKGAVTVAVTFKHEKPIIRERPESAKSFHSVSANDPELKVHYRYSNFRRMPMTALQEQWVDDQEAKRVKKSEEIAKKLFADALAKAAKKKGGDKDKGDKKDKKDKGKKKKEEEVVVKPPCPYKDANHFMATNFPNFEGDDDMEAIGPMRTVQLVEVGRVLACCEEYGVKIKESSLRKALIIPQDKPEAVCLEGLKDETEGLMTNPLAREFWRKFKGGGGGGKKGKKGKKK